MSVERSSDAPGRLPKQVAGVMSRPKNQQKGEHPADLLFWFGDGHLSSYEARVAAVTEVSIGRTNSKRAAGFFVSRGETSIDFVLDRDQVAELVAFLQNCMLPRLLKPLGRKQDQISIATMTKRKG
jgi:hypothetical protein